MKPCDFCIEESCKKGANPHSCNCETCDKRSTCPRILRPTIRVTTRCTQACNHCCFTCSPKRSEMMTPEKAREISQFLTANEIYAINLMGGEIFCHPNWKEILAILLSDLVYARIVTNGDWAGNTDFLGYLTPFKADRDILIAISKDCWHTNAKIEAAVEECEKYGFRYKVATEKETTEESIVPAGRGELCCGFYSFMGCYCHNPQKMYDFLIDEEGRIFKCGFGAWDYANTSDYLEGGFAARFKEFNQVFYRQFIASCASCQRSWDRCKDKR